MKLNKKHLKEEIRKIVRKRLDEAMDDGPTEDWAKYGKEVDDFINETMNKADELRNKGEKLLFGEDLEKEMGLVRGKKFNFVSMRTGFLKRLVGQLSQRFESMKRERL